MLQQTKNITNITLYSNHTFLFSCVTKDYFPTVTRSAKKKKSSVFGRLGADTKGGGDCSGAKVTITGLDKVIIRNTATTEVCCNSNTSVNNLIVPHLR